MAKGFYDLRFMFMGFAQARGYPSPGPKLAGTTNLSAPRIGGTAEIVPVMGGAKQIGAPKIAAMEEI